MQFSSQRSDTSLKVPVREQDVNDLQQRSTSGTTTSLRLTSPVRRCDINDFRLSSETKLQPITAKLQSGDYISISDADAEGFGKAIKIKNLEIDDIVPVLRDQFIDSLRCIVCKITIDPQIHCRLCGHTVCKPCSRRNINENKVCDLCFMRNFMRNTQQRNDAINETKKSRLQELRKNQLVFDQQINQIDKDIRGIVQANMTPEQFEKQIKDEQNQLDIIIYKMNLRNQQYENRQQENDEQCKQLADMKMQIKNIDGDIKNNESELFLKKQLLQQKIGQLQTLTKLKQKVTSSKSFLAFQGKFGAQHNKKIDQNLYQQSDRRDSMTSSQQYNSNSSQIDHLYQYPQQVKSKIGRVNWNDSEISQTDPGSLKKSKVKDEPIQKNDKSICSMCVLY